MDYFSLSVGFLIGAATGAAGTYFGNKYTDQRRKKEQKKEQAVSFNKLWQNHSLLLTEMSSDLKLESSHFSREFYAISKRKNYNLKKGENLVYYIEEHDNLIDQLNILVAKKVIDQTRQPL